eukprot:scaffold10473_cov25-Tisochrysis_lutea.AAC.4
MARLPSAAYGCASGTTGTAARPAAARDPPKAVPAPKRLEATCEASSRACAAGGSAFHLFSSSTWSKVTTSRCASTPVSSARPRWVARRCAASASHSSFVSGRRVAGCSKRRDCTRQVARFLASNQLCGRWAGGRGGNESTRHAQARRELVGAPLEGKRADEARAPSTTSQSAVGRTS